MMHFAVGVPAKDEAELLPRCLAALAEAARHVFIAHPGSTVHVTIALDACTDNSAEVVQSARGAFAVPGTFDIEGLNVTAGSAGRARQAACVAALDRVARESGPDLVWVATTDADTVVPARWLTAQREAYLAGHDVFVGTAQPDPAELDAGRLARFNALHQFTHGHPHVHGASLGLTSTAFHQVGGFSPLNVGEDQDLVDRARAAGLQVLATDVARVTTSARLTSRVRGGFADYLAALPQ